MNHPIARRSLLRASGLLVVAAAAPTALTACASSSADPGRQQSQGADSAAPRRGGSLRAACTSSSSDSLDVTKAGYGIAATRALAVYERLATSHPDGTVTPRLYKSLTPNADATAWTLELKRGARFADGRPVTSADVIASLAAVQGTEFGAPIAALDPAASKALDDTSATLALRSPIADLPNRLGSGLLVIMPGGRPATDAGALNGSGPYRVESFTPGQRTVLVRRPDYWDGDARGYLDRIELVAAQDPKGRLQALLSGQVDWADDIAHLDAQQLTGNSRVTVHRSAAQSGLAWFLNMAQPPFDNPKVRLAFKYAVDRKALVDTTLYGFGTVGNDLWGLGLPSYYRAAQQRPHDIDRAKALLAEAGVGRVKATFLTSQVAPGVPEATQLLAEQVRPAGFDLTIDSQPVDTYFADTAPWFRASGVSYADIFSFTEMAPLSYLQDSPYNFGWHRPDWEAQYRKAVGTLDPVQRQAGYDALQAQLWDDGPDLVWGFAPKLVAAAPALHGVESIADFRVADLTAVHRS